MYHALTPERRHLALKIYKTSILVFKDRDRYVSGEYRFRRGYRSVFRTFPRLVCSLLRFKAATTLAKWSACGPRRRCGT